MPPYRQRARAQGLLGQLQRTSAAPKSARTRSHRHRGALCGERGADRAGAARDGRGDRRLTPLPYHPHHVRRNTRTRRPSHALAEPGSLLAPETVARLPLLTPLTSVESTPGETPTEEQVHDLLRAAQQAGQPYKVLGIGWVRVVAVVFRFISAANESVDASG